MRSLPDDDGRTLRAARRGDAEALGRLYEEFAEGLYRTAYRLTRSSADARDVVQDVFVGLPEALATFEARGSLRGWMRTVTIRMALMRLRTQRRRREVSFSSVAFALHRPSRASVAVDRLALERAVEGLPESLRVVYVLKELEGLSHREIGEMLGIREGASANRLYRARRRLRDLLSEERGD